MPCLTKGFRRYSVVSHLGFSGSDVGSNIETLKIFSDETGKSVPIARILALATPFSRYMKVFRIAVRSGSAKVKASGSQSIVTRGANRSKMRSSKGDR